MLETRLLGFVVLFIKSIHIGLEAPPVGGATLGRWIKFLSFLCSLSSSNLDTDRQYSLGENCPRC